MTDSPASVSKAPHESHSPPRQRVREQHRAAERQNENMGGPYTALVLDFDSSASVNEAPLEGALGNPSPHRLRRHG